MRRFEAEAFSGPVIEAVLGLILLPVDELPADPFPLGHTHISFNSLQRPLCEIFEQFASRLKGLLPSIGLLTS